MSSSDVIEAIRGIYGRAALEIGVSTSVTGVPSPSISMRVGRSEGPHVTIASDVVSILEHGGRAGSWYLVILDEFRAADPRGLADFLDVRQIHVKHVNERLYECGRDIVIDMIATTSDARARRRVGGKVPWILMRNLPRRAAEELIEQLGIGEEGEVLWRLAGGNPRALELIKREGLGRWLKSEVIELLARAQTLNR